MRIRSRLEEALRPGNNTAQLAGTARFAIQQVDDLIQMAKSDPDSGVRGQALFWLAQKAGKKAVGTLNEAIQDDPNFEVKKKAVFALSQLPKDESVPQLVHVADTNSNFEIRKQAIFWLGQSNDPRALAYIEAVLKR